MAILETLNGDRFKVNSTCEIKNGKLLIDNKIINKCTPINDKQK